MAEPRLDANLLPVLEALLEERSVTRAAERLGMGQPGMSHALQKLREHFSDPLLVRAGRAMELSPLAADLIAPVREAMRSIRAVLAPTHAFDPGTAKRLFRIATSDHVGLVLMPHVMDLVAAEAPQVDLDIRPISAATIAAELSDAAVDFAIGAFPDVPPALTREELFTESFQCLVREGHPCLDTMPLSTQAFAALSHVLISPNGDREGALDRILAERGLSRRIALSVPHFLLAPFMVASTDYILTLPQSLAKRFAEVAELRAIDPPVDLPPFTIAAAWHQRNDSAPAHRWLRQLLRRAAAKVKP